MVKSSIFMGHLYHGYAKSRGPWVGTEESRMWPGGAASEVPRYWPRQDRRCVEQWQEGGEDLETWWIDTYLWSYYIWLVLWNINFIFPYIKGIIIPIDFHIFQRGSKHQPVYHTMSYYHIEYTDLYVYNTIVYLTFYSIPLYTIIHMGVSINGGTQIAGWSIKEHPSPKCMI